MSKEHMIIAIQLIASKLGFEMKAADGRDAWTGHVFRISGPRHLCRHGVQVATILLLARWAGATIMWYLKDAPLLGVTKEYMKGKRTAKATMPTDEQPTKDATQAKKFTDKCLKQLGALEAEVREHEDKLRKLVK